MCVSLHGARKALEKMQLETADVGDTCAHSLARTRTSSSSRSLEKKVCCARTSLHVPQIGQQRLHMNLEQFYQDATVFRTSGVVNPHKCSEWGTQNRRDALSDSAKINVWCGQQDCAPHTRGVSDRGRLSPRRPDSVEVYPHSSVRLHQTPVGVDVTLQLQLQCAVKYVMLVRAARKRTAVSRKPFCSNIQICNKLPPLSFLIPWSYIQLLREITASMKKWHHGFYVLQSARFA